MVMPMAPRIIPLLASLLGLAACAPPLTGVVRDGSGGEPVADAEVTLHWVGWGRAADGQLVWDAPKSETTRSAADGKFRFGRDGGIWIDVTTPGATTQRAEGLHENMTIYVGGPWPGLSAGKALLVPWPGETATAELREEFAIEPALTDLGVAASGAAFEDGFGELVLAGQGGKLLAFVEGSGAIPAPPPAAAWRARLALDLRADIGWAFIGRPGAPEAVLAIGPLSSATSVGGRRVATMLYTPLPAPAPHDAKD